MVAGVFADGCSMNWNRQDDLLYFQHVVLFELPAGFEPAGESFLPTAQWGYLTKYKACQYPKVLF